LAAHTACWVRQAAAVCVLRTLMRRLLCAWLVFALACAANASELAEIRGRVVAVADGDTLTVLDAQRNAQQRVRLQGIDAPEGRQPYGRRARQYLADLVHQQEVRVSVDKVDRFGRVVGVLYLQDEDINQRMIQSGLAWHLRPYAHEQTRAKRRAYAAAEQHARRERLGLWADPNPVAPWEFRRDQRR
jgi:endonuclease YncB( thermonuclease family)